jgi:uncharacterized membrane protein YhaH (DUF805 family)
MRVIKLAIAWCFAATAILCLWDVVRFIPTKVYTDGSGVEPSMVAKAVLLSIFLALGSLFATASWMVLRARDSARKWALLASFVVAFAGFLLLYAHPLTLLQKGWIPLLIGIAGLVVFYRIGGNDQQSQIPSAPVPSDGTNAIVNRLIPLFAILAVLGVGQVWSRWGQAHHLSQDLPPYFYLRFIFVVLLVIALHESGHLLAALALRMKIIHVAIGPLEWSNSFGKKKIRMQAGFRYWLRGQTLVAPKDIQGFRERKISQVAAGPSVSIVTGLMSTAIVIMSVGSAWEDSWLILSRFATISLALGVFNLVPFRIGAGYSDGAKLFQLLSSGLWCRYQLLLGMIYASTVTPIRARDFDIDTIQEAAGNIAKGYDELFMHLFAYACFLDRGELSNAAAAMTTASSLGQEPSVAVPAEWMTTFVFGTAFLLRDPVAARRWWSEFEQKKTDKLTIESWTSLSALLWIERRLDEAEEAWHKGEKWAREMPDSGFAEGERNAVLLLRRAMDEAADFRAE